MQTSNAAAQEAYASAHAQCLALVAQIRFKLQDAEAPSDATNWGHVSEMLYLREQLREIVDPE